MPNPCGSAEEVAGQQMTNGNVERAIAAAREVADRLDAWNAHFDAEAVRRACRSLSASRETSQRHFQAALVLRQQLKDAGLEPKA
jgi:hypothetical protein